MVQYRKPSYRTRTKLTHRFLHYLHNRTSLKFPEWRDTTIRFCFELFELTEKNPSINMIILRDDGLYLYSGAKPIAYVHFRQKHFLVHAKRDYQIWQEGDGLFGARQEGSWPRMWRASTRKQVDRFLSFLKDIPSVSLPASRKKSRNIPEWVKDFVSERDNHACVVPNCRSKENIRFDHIIPYSMGGASDHPDNIQILCSKCNAEKSASLKH